jgi:flagellar assembly protein FliH
MSRDKKFLFDKHIFDAPEPEEIAEDLPPPPPVFSEDELAAAKDMAFEQGRLQGQKEQVESREQFVAVTLDTIAQNFSKLFAAEAIRESIFEKESLRLAIAALDLLSPLVRERLGGDEVRKVIEETLSAHRKTKEIAIRVPQGMKGEIEALVTRIRSDEHEAVLWRVLEDAALSGGDCTLEWSDGGAVRDSVRTARDIRKNLESLLGEPQEPISEIGEGDVSSDNNGESAPGEQP